MAAGHDTGGAANMRRPPRTTCKVCWESIFGDEETKWVVTPHPGIAHTTCTPRDSERG